LSDRLDDHADEFGVYATDQLSIRFDDLAGIARTMASLRERPPTTLLGADLTALDDLLPDNDVLTMRSASARVVVRPSGTEPKLKAYLEVVEPVSDGDVPAARARAAAALRTLKGETATALGTLIP
jgi:phosphomannomutase